jgi:hypothetical protein
MADFESVQGIRGPKLSDLAQHVTDVLAITLAEEDEYQVGKLSLAAYDFVPYALTGLSAAMQTPSSGTRATTHVTLPLSDDAGATTTAEQDVTLFGPGDVIGVDPGQIVRRYPSPGSTNAEETFHAHIEFDRPELPWAFSARTPGDQMPAWLALVALETTEIEWEPSQAGLQPIMAVEGALLPPLGEAWAWAHAQAAGGSAALTARLSTAFAPVNVSRLLAARVLTQNTNYTACLVPTTEIGRNAGLGVAGGGLGPAWTNQDGIVRLPVYDRWEFRTAPDGDFARLARRLVGVAAPWAIGRQIMDASRPGRPLVDLAAGESGDRQVIRCALFSPNPPPPGVPSDSAAWTAARIADLKAEVERPALIEGTAGTDPGDIPLLPIVGPRLYAKGQRGTGTVPEGDWFAELNLTPTHRVVGGLGTRVVIKDQEPLMQSAWAQVGDIDKANRELALAELARNLAKTLHARLAKIDAGRLLQATRPLAGRVRLDGNTLTLAGQTVRSATPTAALGGSFRRAVRTTGPLTRRLTGAERSTVVRMVADDVGPRDFTRPYSDLDGIGGLSPTAIESLDASAVAVALGVPVADALATVKSSTELLGQAPSLATTVTTPELWKAPDAGFRPGAVVTQRIAAQIRDRVPADPATDVVRSRAIGGLASGLAVTGVDTASDFSDVALRLESAVMATAPRASVTPGPGAVTPVVVRPSPTRDAGAAMLRGAAARVAVAPTGLSPTAAGRVSGSIIRPVNPADGGAVVLSERDRLDRFRTADGTNLATWIERANRVTVADVRAGLEQMAGSAGALALTTTPAREVLAVKPSDLLARLDPTRTVIGAMRARLNTGLLTFDPFLLDLIRPIMAAPRFDRPMYQALDSYDREWLVPGLGTLPEPELVTLLEANDAFTEAFLVGLSDEMGRELLWRSYPTDSRGTYFHRFWDANHDELSKPIHRFARTKLGSHVSIGPNQQSGRAVVVIRGEVVRRYPDLTVMAMKESGQDDDNHPLLPEAPTGLPDAAPSLFHAMLPPDIMLAGLDITVNELREGGWWIVIGEHPQAARFRRHEADLTSHEARFAKPGAHANAAAVAAARLENPTRVAFEAGDFLPATS